MSWMRLIRFGAAVAAAVAVLVTVGAATATTMRATSSFRSRALRGQLHYTIQLPSGYGTSGLHYPVIYFLHGLPATAGAYQTLIWVERALEATGRPAILVVAQGASAAMSDPEYHDWGAGNNWETALADELPAYIDAHYRTIASRSGRAIIGYSAGGYGATILGLHNLAKYSVIESWSGYFRPTDPSGVNTLDVGSQAEDDYASVHSLVATLKRRFQRYPTFLGFYVGKSDPTFVADNTRLHRELTAARISHLFELYAGGHTTSLWQAHAVLWLTLALDHLQTPTT
jgi:enterochelin esterase-like enzyme